MARGAQRVQGMSPSRRRAGFQGQNLDSLLDTMANVVGILIVLVAVTQLTLGDAVKRIATRTSVSARH